MMVYVILFVLIGMFWADHCCTKNMYKGDASRTKQAICFFSNFFFWWIAIPGTIFAKHVLKRDTLF